MKTRIFGFLFLLCTLLTSGAFAGPRITGRLSAVQAPKRLVVVVRSDGKHVRGLVRKDATLKRLAAEVSLGSFRVGDYVVIEVEGPLNDDPVDVTALMDVNTAGVAPTAQGSGYTAVQVGTIATVGGSGAPLPFTKAAETATIALGGSQNIPMVAGYQMEGAPKAQFERATEKNVGAFGSTEAGTSATVQIPKTLAYPNPAPAAGSQGGSPPPPLPYSPPAPTTPNIPMTAAPAPMGSPYTAQVLASSPQGTSAYPTPGARPTPYGGGVGGYVPPAAAASASRYVPPTAGGGSAGNPATRYVAGDDDKSDDSLMGVPNSGGPTASTPVLVNLQGNVTQVNPSQRAFYLQTNLQGRPSMVAVVVPAQVFLTLTSTGQTSPLDSLRTGDFVLVSGIQSVGGTVEARKLYVKR